MQYNKTLDYTVLALDALRQSKPVLAARLFAKAGEQKDLTAAIQILEHSNKTAHAAEVKAKLTAKRLKANEQESPEFETEEEEAPVEAEFEGDPLDEVEVEEEHEEAPVETPAATMASVLKNLVRK